MGVYFKRIFAVIRSSFLLTIILISIHLLIAFVGLYKTNSAQEGVDKEHVYFELQQESSPFDVPLENYVDFYSQLCSNSEFEYYECYLQYLEMRSESESFFDYETETLQKGGDAVLCVQISENLQNRNHFECCRGRLFDTKDFQYYGGTIPVILGYEYRDVYQIGFQFTAVYLYHTYNFEVVGILEKNSIIQNPGTTILLDKYIIMPGFNVCSMPQENAGITIHYANKTSGCLVAPTEKFAEVSNCIKQLLLDQKCGYYTMDIFPVKYNVIEKTGFDIGSFIIGLSIIFLAFHILYYRHVKKAKKYIIKNRFFFACAELAGTGLLFLTTYYAFSFLISMKMDMRILGIFGIFVIVTKYVYLPPGREI